jgi:hypothetical protein
LASSISRNDFDDFPVSSQAGNIDSLEEDIIWMNQDLEELVRLTLFKAKMSQHFLKKNKN